MKAAGLLPTLAFLGARKRLLEVKSARAILGGSGMGRWLEPTMDEISLEKLSGVKSASLEPADSRRRGILRAAGRF